MTLLLWYSDLVSLLVRFSELVTVLEWCSDHVSVLVCYSDLVSVGME